MKNSLEITKKAENLTYILDCLCGLCEERGVTLREVTDHIRHVNKTFRKQDGGDRNHMNLPEIITELQEIDEKTKDLQRRRMELKNQLIQYAVKHGEYKVLSYIDDAYEFKGSDGKTYRCSMCLDILREESPDVWKYVEYFDESLEDSNE